MAITIRLGGGREVVLVSRSDVLTAVPDNLAQRLAACVLEQHPDLELVDGQVLSDALARGRLSLVRLDAKPRRLDKPQVRDLLSLGPMDGVPEPPRPRSDAWVEVEVVDSRGRPLPGYRVQVLDPTGSTHAMELDGQGMARLDGLAEDGGCTVTLTRREPP